MAMFIISCVVLFCRFDKMFLIFFLSTLASARILRVGTPITTTATIAYSTRASALLRAATQS